MESEAESQEKGSILILAIPIPSSLWLWFRLQFLIHTETEGSLNFWFQLHFQFNRQREPALKITMIYKITAQFANLSFDACTSDQFIHYKQRSMCFVILCKNNPFLFSVCVLKTSLHLFINLLRTIKKEIDQE